MRRLVAGLAVASVVLASLAGGLGALAVVTDERELSIGTVSLSVSPFHDGALDVYVPVVDWGARFPAVRAPARVKVDVRAIDRDAVLRLAQGASIDVHAVRDEARDAIASFLRIVLLATLLAALAAGAVAALVVRGGAAPQLRWLLAAAGATALAGTVALTVTLPPRGAIDRPQYYAFGPDIPRALEAIASVRRSTRTLDQELDAQLVGLARLVSAPAGRPPVVDAPRLTIASDLHNNVLALPVLERVAEGGPLLFAGDLTDRGSHLETVLISRAVEAGDPFVFVTGNHDSDVLARRVARQGGVVLTQHGRMDGDGRVEGPAIQEVAGLRVAGYSDPFERRAAEDFADRFEPEPGIARQAAFATWLDDIVGAVDIVMVHDGRLAETALAAMREDPPATRLVLITGHTHRAGIERIGELTVLNGGSVGAGGTGNLGESTRFGIARLSYRNGEGFEPLAADLVEIDPGSGSATARRERLDEPEPPD